MKYKVSQSETDKYLHPKGLDFTPRDSASAVKAYKWCPWMIASLSLVQTDELNLA